MGINMNENAQRGIFQTLIKRTMQSIINSKKRINLFFYYLVHPLLFIQKVILSFIQSIKYYVKNTLEYVLNPFKIIKAIFDSIRKFVLFIRVTFLFILIVQHTASITFNASKLYQAFKKHKVNLVKLQILGQE